MTAGDRLQRLWTPHRMAYVVGDDPTSPEQDDGLPVLPDPAALPTRTGWSWRAASWRTPCSTCTRTTPGT